MGESQQNSWRSHYVLQLLQVDQRWLCSMDHLIRHRHRKGTSHFLLKVTFESVAYENKTQQLGQSKVFYSQKTWRSWASLVMLLTAVVARHWYSPLSLRVSGLKVKTERLLVKLILLSLYRFFPFFIHWMCWTSPLAVQVSVNDWLKIGSWLFLFTVTLLTGTKFHT